MKTEELRNDRVYVLEDGTLVNAVELSPGQWQLWSMDDNREFEIRPDGAIYILPFRVGNLEDLEQTGARYDPKKQRITPDESDL